MLVHQAISFFRNKRELFCLARRVVARIHQLRPMRAKERVDRNAKVLVGSFDPRHFGKRRDRDLYLRRGFEGDRCLFIGATDQFTF